jgi:hypothetical protein
VHDLARFRAPGGQLPQLLEADAVGLGIAVLVERVFRDELFAQRTAAALGEDRRLRDDVDALRVTGLVRTVLRHAHVADAHTAHGTGVIEQRLGCGKARVDLDAECLGLRRQPRAQRAE